MFSPFPGMDPYIEQRRIWTDFHGDLAGEIRAELNRQLNPNYFARLTPYTTYEAIEISQSKHREPRTKGIEPDVGLLKTLSETKPTYETTVLEPVPVKTTVTVEFPLELLSVEVYEAEEEQLVTAIEILSPVNKTPSHRAYKEYIQKRQDLLHSNVHLLELDLLRKGTRPPLDHPVPKAPYYISLSRVEERPEITVWPIHLNSRLPIVPIPLVQGDGDAEINLNEIIATVYERGGYHAQINYHKPVPLPKLSAQEIEWVDLLLAGHRI